MQRVRGSGGPGASGAENSVRLRAEGVPWQSGRADEPGAVQGISGRGAHAPEADCDRERAASRRAGRRRAEAAAGRLEADAVAIGAGGSSGGVERGAPAAGAELAVSAW